MNFKIIDKDLSIQFEEIRRRIRRLQSGGTIDSLETIGADTSHQIGASFVSLKQLASNYSPNETLALLLWNEQNREEQIMACLLLPEDTNKEKITQLIRNSLNFEIAEYFGSLYLHRHIQFFECVKEWLDTNHPYQQTAALTAIFRHHILHKNDEKISDRFYLTVLQREYENKYVQRLIHRYRLNL